MPQNGDINENFGIYKSLCCGQEILIRDGTTFPDCPNHSKLSTIWKHVEAEVIQMQTIKKKSESATAA